MHYGDRMCGVLLGPGLVTENAEGQDRGADRPVPGLDLVHQRNVRGQVVGVELAGLHVGSARRPDRLHLVGQLVGPAGRKHHRVARRQPDGQFQADLAPAAEDDDHLAASIRRVVHGCDYHLRYF